MKKVDIYMPLGSNYSVVALNCPHCCPPFLHTPAHLGTSLLPLLCLAAPSSQMLPGLYNFCPAEQPSWRQCGVGGGEGAPAAVLGGSGLPPPYPPSSPLRTSLMRHPPVPAVLVTQQDSRTWTRVASSPQAEPPTPRRSHHCLRVCGVGGPWQDPHHAVDQGHCCRAAAGRWPETDLTQSERVCSAATTSTTPEGPGQVRGRAHSTTWGWVWPVSAAQIRGAGCSSGRALPSPPSHLLSSSFQHDGDSEAFFSLLRQSWSERERRGRSEGQHKAKGPAPLTRHRDKSDLFILVKVTRTTLIRILLNE